MRKVDLEKLSRLIKEDPSSAASQLQARVSKPGGAKDADAQYLLGVTLLELRQYAQARQTLTRAMLLDPSRPAAQYYLAVCSEKLGKVAEARTIYLRLLDQDPTYPGARERLEQLSSAGASNATQPPGTVGPPHRAPATPQTTSDDDLLRRKQADRRASFLASMWAGGAVGAVLLVLKVLFFAVWIGVAVYFFSKWSNF